MFNFTTVVFDGTSPFISQTLRDGTPQVQIFLYPCQTDSSIWDMRSWQNFAFPIRENVTTLNSRIVNRRTLRWNRSGLRTRYQCLHCAKDFTDFVHWLTRLLLGSERRNWQWTANRMQSHTTRLWPNSICFSALIGGGIVKSKDGKSFANSTCAFYKCSVKERRNKPLNK